MPQSLSISSVMMALGMLLISGCGGCQRNSDPNGTAASAKQKASSEAPGKPPVQPQAVSSEDEEELDIRPLVEPPETDPLSPRTREAVRELVKLEAELLRDEQGHVIAVTLPAGTEGEAFEHVAQLVTLRRLVANQSTVTDEHLAALKSLTSLRELELADVRIGPAAMTALAKHPRLERLVLAGSDLTNDQLLPLAKLNKLAELDVSWTKIGDEGLKHFQHFEGLRQLDLSYTPVTDAQLDRLAQLSSLETLILDGTDVTPAGVQQFRNKRPQLKILGVP